eukprot:TRINITY_DN7424_c0_g1_i1.p2 TRINITY_DN7424_c0_g1~~TRINITY_DN7424_c0_g1_i1.p2  ORF type:complete len:114 (+),score=11.02 TRINITY_DN7424_c0_g1_i1:129-470(+)
MPQISQAVGRARLVGRPHLDCAVRRVGGQDRLRGVERHPVHHIEVRTDALQRGLRGVQVAHVHVAVGTARRQQERRGRRRVTFRCFRSRHRTHVSPTDMKGTAHPKVAICEAF